jgi:hypothetical protein
MAMQRKYQKWRNRCDRMNLNSRCRIYTKKNYYKINMVFIALTALFNLLSYSLVRYISNIGNHKLLLTVGEVASNSLEAYLYQNIF